MDELKEVLALLKEVKPMLVDFKKWKEAEDMREKIAAEAEAESQKEFNAWVEERRKAEATQEKDTEELQKHFFGGEKWERERFAPHNF
jgi:rubrerythrin